MTVAELKQKLASHSDDSTVELYSDRETDGIVIYPPNDPYILYATVIEIP